jgi:hypothetical protein
MATEGRRVLIGFVERGAAMRRLSGYLAVMFLISSFAAVAQTAQPQASSGAVVANADVVAMVKAGLDEAVIIAKIRHSPVSFDVSTAGLIDLKNSGVPSSIVTVMLERPQGAPAGAPPPKETAAQPQPVEKKATSLQEVSKVWIKADSEVLRVTIQKRLEEQRGPAVALSEGEADATFSFATDCGAQTISMWSGANFCTCEGSLTIEAAGKQLWTDLEHERSANAAKASKKLAEQMTENFVRAWLKAKGK